MMRSFLQWLGLYPYPAPVQAINLLHLRTVDEIIAGERILVNQDARDVIAWMKMRLQHLEQQEKKFFANQR